LASKRDRQLTTTSCLSPVEGSSCYGVYRSALSNSLTASLPPARCNTKARKLAVTSQSLIMKLNRL
jgi:hypothetical protein